MPGNALAQTDDATQPESTTRTYFPALDGLRAIAAIFVFLQHYLFNTLDPRFAWGWTGVDIFFVLSGFLITGILHDSRDLLHRTRNFYVRRTLRIFPLYYGVLLVILLLTPLLHWNWDRFWLLWPIYLENLSRFLSLHFSNTVVPDALFSSSTGYTIYLGHFWSLCLEEQFYLLWPFVVFGIRDRVQLRNLCLLVVLLSPLLRLLAVLTLPASYLDAELLYRTLPFRLDALLLGGALALTMRGPEWHTLTRHIRSILLAAVVLFAASHLLFVNLLGQPDSGGPSIPWISTIGFTFVDLIAACVLVLCLRPGSLAYRFFRLKPLVRLGQISYGFYVFHDIPRRPYAEITVRLFPHAANPGMLMGIVAFPCTVALALLSFRFFESPILRLKDRFTLRSTVSSPHP